MENRLKYFPIPLFAVIMGLGGLSIVYEKAGYVFGIPSIIGKGLVYFTTFLFFVILGAYMMKFIKYPQEVKHELFHPIRINFFPAISISLLLLSIAYYDINYNLSAIFWAIGAPLHLFFTLFVIRYWIVHNIDIKHSNPAWFIPIVGNVLVPITGIYFGGVAVAQFYFSIGIFFWIVLFTIILYRIIFHHQLPEKFLPTLFIFIAPAAVGFISYVKIALASAKLTHAQVVISSDFFAHMLYDVGLFFTILVFFMIPLFARVKYAITWWAYTFPMAAITIASILNYHLVKEDIKKGFIEEDIVFNSIPIDSLFYYLSLGLLIVTTILIFYVFIKTLKAVLEKKICVPE